MARWTDTAGAGAGGGRLAGRLLVRLSFPDGGVEPLIGAAIADLYNVHRDVHHDVRGQRADLS